MMRRRDPPHYRPASRQSEAMRVLLIEIEAKIKRSKRRKLMEIGYRGVALRHMLRAIRL